MADLELAIEKADDAVQLTATGHRNLAGGLCNLANKLGALYERTGQITDLEMAILSIT